MTTTIGLRLEPLDVLFFRDGRPFGAAMHGRSELPLPQTLAGAVCTALLDACGCDFLQLTQRMREGGIALADAIETAGGPPWIASLHVRGPWLAKYETTAATFEVLLPVPAALHAEKSGGRNQSDFLQLLRPLPPDRLPGWQPPESAPGLWPLWLRHPVPTQPASGFLNPAGLQAFLGGIPVQADQVLAADELFALDRRTGIGINPERLSAEQGMIYGASFLALKPEVVLYAEVELPDDVSRSTFRNIDTLAFGGEGRRVRVHVLDQPYRWPESAPAGDRQKPLVLLITPGLFDGRWKPQRLDGALIAAAIPGALAVSGWDLARGGPKPNRFAVQAGSTYFLNQPLDPWPETLAERDVDRQQGWGCYLKGVWTDEQS